MGLVIQIPIFASLALAFLCQNCAEARLKKIQRLMDNTVSEVRIPSMKETLEKFAQAQGAISSDMLPQCSYYKEGVDMSFYDNERMTGNCSKDFDLQYDSFWTPTDSQKKWLDGLSIKQDAAPRIRREMRQLHLDEFQRLTKAFWKLKTTSIDGQSKYDLFRLMHSYDKSIANHRAISLFAWHRVFIFRFENALREIDPHISMPFWDSTLDASLPLPQNAVTWSKYFLGQSIGFLTEGPFAFWPVVKEYCRFFTSGRAYPERYYYKYKTDYLPDNDDIVSLLAYDSYTELVDRYLECFVDVHDTTHGTINGIFGTSPLFRCSFEEPTFAFWHSYIDQVYEAFRMTESYDPETDYPRESIPQYTLDWCNRYDSVLYPYVDMKISDAMKLTYSAAVHYQIRPYACMKESDCNSHYLWCQTGATFNTTVTISGICTSKVRAGGYCKGLINNSCMTGKCSNDYCSQET